MASGDDFLWPPESFEDNADPALAQKIQHSMDIIFAQLRRLQSSAGSTPHDILSETHEDTVVATAVEGDIIRRHNGAWERLGVGGNGQVLEVIAGVPEWSSSAAGLLHNLLSVTHGDTTPASPVLGDLIVAQSVAAADVDAYWFNGEPYNEIPNVADAGDEQYWFNGLPATGLETAGSVTWQRKANSTTAGYVLTAGATGPDWQPAPSGGTGAAIYRSGDLSVSAATPTIIDLDTAIYNDSFWTSGSKLTIPAGAGGRYLIVAAATVDYGFVGDWFVYIYVNGTVKAKFMARPQTTVVGYFGHVQCVSIENLNAADYVELAVEWNYGGGHGPSYTLKGGLTNTFLKVAKL